MTRTELNQLLMECYDSNPNIQQNGDEVPMLETIAAWVHMEEAGFEGFKDRDWICEQLMLLVRVLQDAATSYRRTMYRKEVRSNSGRTNLQRPPDRVEARACPQLSQISPAVRWMAARKLRAVLS